MSNPGVHANASDKIRTTILAAGIIFFALHFIASWAWFKERMLQEDASFYVVKLVQQQTLVCEHFRYSAFLIQCIPYLVMKSGGGLEAVTRSYSVAFDVYYFLLFLFALFVLKNNAGALLLLLFSCLAAGRDYFLPVGEYMHAIMTSTVLCGLSFPGSKISQRIQLFWASLVAICCLNFHPVALFALTFACTSGILTTDSAQRRPWVLLAAVTALVFLLRSFLLPLDDYENNKMKSWTDVAGYFFQPGKLKSIPAVVSYFMTHFPQYIFLFFLSAVILAVKRKFRLGIFHLAFIYFLLVLFGTIKGEGETHIWFGEYFILLGIPLLAPLSEILTGLKVKYVTVTVIAGAMLIFLYQLKDIHSFFEKRINYIQRIIANGKQFPERRYIIDKKNVPLRLLPNTWPIPFQTLLLSSFQHPDSAMSCIAAPGINAWDSLLTSPGYFLGPEWAVEMFNYSDNRLRKQYFNLPEKGYRKLTTSQQYFSASDSVFNGATVSLVPDEQVLYSTTDSVLFTSLKLVNSTKEIIPALADTDHSTFLSYHLADARGKTISWDNLRTPLECDVQGSIQTGLYVLTAGLPKGIYKLEADIVTENTRWWGLQAPVKLVVK